MTAVYQSKNYADILFIDFFLAAGCHSRNATAIVWSFTSLFCGEWIFFPLFYVWQQAAAGLLFYRFETISFGSLGLGRN